LENAVLYGIEFRLYDGRKFYPGDDRISFVFLRMNDCPELDGRIVYVEDKEECKKYYNPMLKGADWYLEKPHIHLRYYCEEWMDMLLAWVKYFYIPDLDYWRYVPLSGYEEFLKLLERFGRGEDSKDLVFVWLKSRFKEEVEEWVVTSIHTRTFWDRVNKTFKKEGED
jgi:hypothetical protein